MSFQRLLHDIADYEARAHGIRKQLVGNPKMGLDFVGIDYMDTLNVNNQLHMGKAALRGLKDLRKALRRLLNYVDYSIYKIQDAVRPLVLHNGINVVPDDILAMIFEKSFESAPGSTRHLASVNRRFRIVALSLPKLWSILPEHSGKEAFDLYLARSRDVGLIVEVNSRNVSSWYGEEMMQLAHRWESVSIIREGIQVVNLLSLSFPRAKAIFVDMSHETVSPVWCDEFNIEWKVPALQHMTFRNATPKLRSRVFENLTSLELRLDMKANVNACYFSNAALLHQLSRMENLQVLSLTLCDASFGETNPSLLCDLSSLTDFNIELSGELTVANLRDFLDNINMKNVQRLSAKLDNKILRPQFKIDPEALFSILITSNFDYRFPNMESAVLVGPKAKEGVGILALENVISHPALRNLYISSADALRVDPIVFEDRKMTFPVVTIVGCNSGVRDFLDQLLTHVNPDGTRLCNSIERLRIFGCSEVTMNYLMDFLPEEKIEWSPVVAINSSQ